MPRIRTVKPSFFTHEELSECSVSAHLLAAALLCYADDEGYFNANPKLIAAACSPLRQINVEKLLGELVEIGYVQLCKASNGKQFGRIVTFDEHQKVNRPTPSKLKAHCDFTESSVSPHCGKGREKEKERKGVSTTPVEPDARQSGVNPVQLVFDCWRESLGHPHAKLGGPKSKRYQAIKARLDDGYTVEELKSAIEGIKHSPHHMGQNERNTVYDDIELICRDQPHVDKFIALAERAKRGRVVQMPARTRQNADAARAAAAAIREENDDDQ